MSRRGHRSIHSTDEVQQTAANTRFGQHVRVVYNAGKRETMREGERRAGITVNTKPKERKKERKAK